jgi:hypothetical protein
MGKPDVTETSLPAESRLHEFIGAGDFIDCYSVSARVPTRRAAEVITDFPGWARVLLLIRKAVTAPFGLTNDAPTEVDAVGIFPVESETERELIAGFDDKHLNFRVSVISDGGCVYLATWVHPHNVAGRLYLKTIMPFHIAISRNALERVGAVPG